MLSTMSADGDGELPQRRHLRSHAQEHDDRRGGRKERGSNRPERIGVVDEEGRISAKLSQVGAAASGMYICSSCSVSQVAARPENNAL